MISQNKQILHYLKHNKRGITSREASRVMGFDRLAARIYELRDAGHMIDTRMEHSEDGKKCWARYFLIKEAGKDAD